MRSVGPPRVKKSRLALTPAPALTNVPGGRLTMQKRSHSSSSFRFIWTNAVSLVRNSTPSSSTMPHRPPGFRLSITCWRKSTCVAPVLYANPGLGLLALLAAEGRIHQDHVEQRRRIGEQPLVRHLVGQRVAVQDVRLGGVVDDEVGQGDGIDRVVLLPTVEGAALEGFELLRRRDLRVPGTGRVLVSLGKEAARTATGVVHRLAHLGIDDTDHRPDDLARSEELDSGLPLLAHLGQEPL